MCWLHAHGTGNLLLGELGLRTQFATPLVYTYSQSFPSSSKGRIYRKAAVAHLTANSPLAIDIARDRGVELERLPNNKMAAGGLMKAL